MSALHENAVARLTYPIRGTTILSVVSLVAIVVRRRGSFAPNFSASRQALREPEVDGEYKLIPFKPLCVRNHVWSIDVAGGVRAWIDS